MARRLIPRFRYLALGASALACVTTLACAGKSVRDPNEDGENAGEGGTKPSGGDGGTSPSGGSSARGGVGGTSSGGTESTGGSSGTTAGGAAARGGSSGSATGGTATGGTATGGSSGSGTCTPCTPQTCGTTILPTQIVNDFENLYFTDDTDQAYGLYGVLDAAGMPKPEWWLGYFSGSYVYPVIPEACSGQPMPVYPLVRNEREGVLRVTGTVGGLSGFGVWLGPCIVDMSAGYGIMFSIGGRAGSGALVMTIGTSSTTDPDACQIGRGKCSTDVCTPPSVRLDITEAPAAIALPWIAFSDGSPAPSVDPREVVQLRWDFEWTDGMAPYPVDVTLDDVMLIQ